jgi:hypothetical protein
MTNARRIIILLERGTGDHLLKRFGATRASVATPRTVEVLALTKHNLIG